MKSLARRRAASGGALSVGTVLLMFALSPSSVSAQETEQAADTCAAQSAAASTAESNVAKAEADLTTAEKAKVEADKAKAAAEKVKIDAEKAKLAAEKAAAAKAEEFDPAANVKAIDDAKLALEDAAAEVLSTEAAVKAAAQAVDKATADLKTATTAATECAAEAQTAPNDTANDDAANDDAANDDAANDNTGNELDASDGDASEDKTASSADESEVISGSSQLTVEDDNAYEEGGGSHPPLIPDIGDDSNLGDDNNGVEVPPGEVGDDDDKNTGNKPGREKPDKEAVPEDSGSARDRGLGSPGARTGQPQNPGGGANELGGAVVPQAQPQVSAGPVGKAVLPNTGVNDSSNALAVSGLTFVIVGAVLLRRSTSYTPRHRLS